METASAPIRIIAIGSSAGGIEALLQLVAALPADLDAAVLIVQHLDPRHDSVLAWLLGRHTKLSVMPARHGETIIKGTVYVAPPDMHLLVANGHVELSQSKLVHFSRPSVDLLFESVAGAYGPAAIGVILTGSGVDGATGLSAIKRMGGTTLAEDPTSATYSGMPSAACATGAVDEVLPLGRIADRLTELVAAGNRTPTR
jgi:two-component system chemotaxis response regulator CheB